MRDWRFIQGPAGQPVGEWAEQLGISPFLLAMLWRRGLTDMASMDAFLSPRLGTLTPPAQWPLIPDAARFLAAELLAGKRPVVWGDWDVDGITATALVLEVLAAHGIKAGYHLPDRRSENYGLNIPWIDRLKAEGHDLLLTVDCGISAHEPIAHAREIGMSVVVSDHHLPGETLPCANAICDPHMQVDGHTPCTDLAGVGVAFYLMAALNAELAPHTGKRLKMDSVLDLVALGTLADAMRLAGENRVLVRAGLDRMANTPRPGLAALKTISKMDAAAELSSWQVVFKLTPRLNAAGRMGNADLALALLREDDAERAQGLALELDAMNRARKAEEDRITSEARIQASNLLARKDYASLVLYGSDWHAGVVGIVASRIQEEFLRPTIILCDDLGCLKGSARSMPNFDINAGLAQVADCLLSYGGHRVAAGVRLNQERLGEFRERFDAVARQALTTAELSPVVDIECELGFDRIDLALLKELKLMQPFGNGNDEPVFASPPLRIREVRPLGHSGEHVTLRVQDTKSEVTLEAKAWRMAGEFQPDMAGRTIQLAFVPHLDSYNGVSTINLEIKDWRPAVVPAQKTATE